jgi:hypothetical protein
VVLLSMSKYFKENDQYIATQDKSPKGFKNVLVIVYTGPTPDKVTEQLRGVADFEKLEKVSEVPDEWAQAFAQYGFTATKVDNKSGKVDNETSLRPVPRQTELTVSFRPNKAMEQFAAIWFALTMLLFCGHQFVSLFMSIDY